MRRQFLMQWWALVAVTAVLAACSSSSDVDATDDAAAAAAKYLAAASDFEKEILSDGVVSGAEYERAGLAVIACIEDSGFIQAELLEGAGNLKRGVSVWWQGSDDPAAEEELRERVDTIRTECVEEYWLAVDHVYHKQAKPTEAERVELLEELVDCLLRLGIDGLRVDASQQEFVRAAGAYDLSTDGLDGAHCLNQAEMAFFERAS